MFHNSIATEGHKDKIYDFVAVEAEQCDIIEDYHIAKLSKHGEDCKFSKHIPYDSLKHFFKIYINNFPGASDLRAQLMETHSVPEAHKVLDLWYN